MVASWNIHPQLVNEIRDELGVNVVEKHSRYLGLPVIVGLNKREIFRVIEERIQRKALDWKYRLLSFAGWKSSFENALETEVFAILQALMLLARLNISEAVVFSDSLEAVSAEFSRYFREMLGKARTCSIIDPQTVAQGPVVNSEQCRPLVRGATDKEIWTTLISIGADKSPGPDGFSSSFFKSNWHILGKELCEGVRHCLRHNALPKGVNTAYIALIPKSGQACKLED
ncbi:hypothetical protein QQ045_032105 [Rhodiola kirilowii]